MADVSDFLAVLERDGPVAASRLMVALNISQPTLSRLLRTAGPQVIRLGKARATRYAARRLLMGSHGAINLYAIDKGGRPHQQAALVGLARDQYLVEASEKTFWLLGQAGNGLCESLPYFLHDVRPQGFMGRQIAQRYARTHGYPDDPRDWNDEQVLTCLTTEAYDLPGNTVVGDNAMTLWHSSQRHTVDNREKAFPELASRVLAEGLPGSSAGGEQQKFTCHTAENGHVIVKFSPAGDTAEAVRWRDLLICEHHALTCLSAAGLSACSTWLYEFAGRVFLEVKRFDRIGDKGRVPMLSLSAIDAEFTGLGQSWSKVAAQLHQEHLLSQDGMHTCVFYELYAQWIGNTDRHLGNLSMTSSGNQFALLPAYDMVPMLYAPERGEVVARNIHFPVRPMQHADLWRKAGECALRFWQSVSEESRIAQDFRRLAEDNHAAVQSLLADA